MDELTTGNRPRPRRQNGDSPPFGADRRGERESGEDGAFREELTAAAVQIIQAMCCDPDDPVADDRLTAAAAALERALACRGAATGRAGCPARSRVHGG